MVSEMERFDKHRRLVRTRSGPVSYAGTGGPGRPCYPSTAPTPAATRGGR
jgi:hypothetical protein